ncbi:hypothetical protein NLG97_g10564 [Lecanicillium saksenae]|uniref:Uncharacterized protein n=1 Tax=Lecanicillium saksenae TaxID=468837 RepID=A0ACC1QE92_9HYPO|nr:hypothetical protein NLG97_g10564 [Lecanicillium saksenae]
MVRKSLRQPAARLGRCLRATIPSQPLRATAHLPASSQPPPAQQRRWHSEFSSVNPNESSTSTPSPPTGGRRTARRGCCTS